MQEHAKYRLGSLEIEWVRSERRVRKGCILSPTLFRLYTKEMADRMIRVNAGVRVDGNKICLLLYADDVVVMSETAEELQSLLDVVSGSGMDFGVKFSSEKSKVTIIDRSEDERDTVWRLGENKLEQTREYKFLGMCMSPHGCERIKN